MTPFEIIPSRLGGLPIAIVCDHASNTVPQDITLGVPASRMREHIAVDLGAAPLARALAELTGGVGFLATMSRLVVDMNRPTTDLAIVPKRSDGVAIPGNSGLNREQRAQRFGWHADYHKALDRLIEAERPKLIVSVHSFTPQLATAPGAERPWRVGVLYNRDGIAARLALDWLREYGLEPGDNQPYSGTELNYTMNRHAETRGLPYLGFEVRQDELASAEGIRRWADFLGNCTRAVLGRFEAPFPALNLPCAIGA